MKHLILVLCLLISSLVHAETAQEWNKRFSLLNPSMPYNFKIDAVQHQKYLKGILVSAVGHMYINPDNFNPVPIVPTFPSGIPTIPIIPTTQSHSLANVLAAARETVRQIEELSARQGQ